MAPAISNHRTGLVGGRASCDHAAMRQRLPRIDRHRRVVVSVQEIAEAAGVARRLCRAQPPVAVASIANEERA